MSTYTCPMHPEVKQKKMGKCPKCGMKLELVEKVKAKSVDSEKGSYFPLFLIIGLISLVTFVLGLQAFLNDLFSWQTALMNFMAGFFLVFSGFKLLDIKGFAEGYSMYDLLARKVFAYGYIYPLIELTLGVLFLLHINHPFLHLFTFLLMSFSGLGVAIKIRKKEKFQCACLGTLLKVPLTEVTLVEDFGMAGMALIMFILSR